MLKMNNSLLNDSLVREDIKILRTSWNLMKILTYHANLWDTIKAVLKGNFIALNAVVKNLERSYTNNLIPY